MFELESKLKDVYSRLEEVRNKMLSLEKEKDELARLHEENLSVIETLKQENQDLERRLEGTEADRLNGDDLNGDLRKEIQQYITVIDECLDHLKKL